MAKLYFTLFFFLLVVVSNAQNYLKQYKETFVKEHAILNSAKLDVDYSKLEYEKAKKDRYPSIMLNSYYSLQHGGREFEIPTGTLLNPVYNNLTYLNSSDFPEDTNSYPKEYGQVENSNINFLRKREYDANLTTSIPLLNFSTREAIQYKKLEEDLTKLKYEELQLKEWSDFKVRYFSYFKQQELINILEVKKKEVEAFYTQIESLKRNNKVIENRVKKVELDKLQVALKIKEAKAALENNKTFLLTTLAKEEHEKIELDNIDLADYQLNYTKEEILKIWKNNSTNVKLMNQRSKILEKTVLLSKEAYKPSLNLLLRAGLQGEDFDADEKPLYLVGSLQFNWNLYNPKNKIENKQIEIIAQKNVIENQSLERNTNFQIQEVYEKIKLELSKIDYASKSLEYNKLKSFEVKRKYEEGKATYYDVYNASLEIERIEVDYIQSKFDYLILVCELEKLIGTELFK